MTEFTKPETPGAEAVQIPSELPILPVRNTVVYPLSVMPLIVGRPRSLRIIEDALKTDRIIGLLTAKDESIEEPQPGQIYETGTVGRILRVMRPQKDTVHVMVHGLARFRVAHWVGTEPYLKARIELSPEHIETDMEIDALQRSLRELAQDVINLSPQVPEEAATLLDQAQAPRELAYLVAANATIDVPKGQAILELDSVKEKLRALVDYLAVERELLSLGKKIKSEAKDSMDKAQREYYLRQQLKAIQKELGESDESRSTADEYREKLDKAQLPEEARKEADRELKRLEDMSPHSSEYSVVRTYLDWLVDLPWQTKTADHLDIDHARTVLDQDHYDLQEVKDRIIEYLAVRKLVTERGAAGAAEEGKESRRAMGTILCFAGPPGVGKTSLGQSIARALGREFTRMSLGGMRDEAEIRGHRRTYVGALPGRIVQAIKRAGTSNPVFMLDEVDKIGNDWRGDPSSALLEVLDPAQNHAFRDHYLDVDFDLSDVIFITTANQLETIPAPLRDRMEIIQLDGYTEHEKIRIAQGFLVPRQLKANALRADEIQFQEEALWKIVRDYTREAGVRNLEREIGAVCRKAVVRIAAGEKGAVEITPDLVSKYLKKEKFHAESSEPIEIPGIATGLAVTAVGGDILFIEATAAKGTGKLTLTGQLGEVMRESVQIAHSYARSKAVELEVDPGLFERTDVHVHVPAGAVPKDGPSAGLAMVMALTSLFSDRPVRSEVGMTGEVTLRGRVLPVGGIKMKVLAAHRSGLKTIILPKRNERDLDELPDEVRKDLTFVLVERIEEAFSAALTAPEPSRVVPKVAHTGWRVASEQIGLN